MKLMQAIKRFLSLRVFTVLKVEEERSLKLEKEVNHIKTLDGEGTWLLKKTETLEDCLNECRTTFGERKEEGG